MARVLASILGAATLLAGCGNASEPPTPTAASASPSATMARTREPWAGCKTAGDAESLAVACGDARFARRDIVVEIDETKVKAHAGSFYFGTTGSEELAEVREGKLDDGTPAWVSTFTGALKGAPGADGQPRVRALVFLGVSRPYGGGVFISAAGLDAESALRDANAMWSSPPPLP